MKEKIEQLFSEIENYKESADGHSAEDFKRKYTGKKGAIQQLFTDFRELSREDKSQFGKLLNELKNRGQEKFNELSAQVSSRKNVDAPEDLTLPGDPAFSGSRHPLMIVMNRIIAVFEKIGFTVADGPEIEEGWFNFDALNMPETHPARDMQDTFFIETDPEVVLRTHTSNIQTRVMSTQKPPIRILAPGKCFRNEAVSARAHVFFHQVEGLYVDTEVSFADLKRILDYFAREMFGEDTKIRLRPSYFPFTEISAEMDVSCLVCKGEGCQLCKYTGWVEIMGCGMVDPAVLENCNIDPEVYSGYAFGMGVERIAQLLYRVPDLRLYSQNDVRFLKQFESIDA